MIQILSVFLSLIFTTAVLGQPTSEKADARDREVLQTVLTNLLSNPQVPLFLKNKNPHTELVFVSRTPPILLPTKEEIEKEVRKVIGDEYQNLVARNSKDRKAKHSSFESIQIPKVVVIDAEQINEEDFEIKYPNARGWIQAWLPGFSEDGNRALVRARKGVALHGAAVTALLEKKDKTWSITWLKVAYWSGR